MTNENKLEEAMRWAIELFESERELDGMPKVMHSIRVGCLLHQAGERNQVIMGGFLHDILEDTEVTYKDIKTGFGETAARLVQACSYDKDLYCKSRQAAFSKLLSTVREYGRDAVAIKVADVMDNIAVVPSSSEKHNILLRKRALDWLRLSYEFLGEKHVLTGQLKEVIKNKSLSA